MKATATCYSSIQGQQKAACQMKSHAAPTTLTITSSYSGLISVPLLFNFKKQPASL